MSTTNRTAAEAKRDRVHVMGAQLGALYDALWQELARMHQKWGEYVSLFGTKQSRLELLNETAPSFFRIVQDSLWEETLLHIARIADSPRTAGKNNLSVRNLPAAIDHEQTRRKVERLIEDALESSKFCRDWRNRRIAHRDLNLALLLHAEPLMPASRERVEHALAALAAVLNAVSLHYLESTTMFEFGSEKGGAISLLHVLKDGLDVDSARKIRRKSGFYDPEDFQSQDL